MILRALCIAVAIALLAAAAHATIVATDGYGSPHSFMVLGVAAGIAVGAIAIGHAISERRIALAVCIGIALACGEAFGLLSTGERLVAQREAAQAPARAAEEAIAKAQQRLDAAAAALDRLPTTSPRLEAALAAKAAADSAATTKAAERGCAANCRVLLEQQVTAAAAEVAAARDELANQRAAAEAEIAAARLTLAAIPRLASGTPLADRLGVAPWILDLIGATLASLAVNGLAVTLMAFGAHTPRREPLQPQAVTPPATVVEMVVEERQASPAEHAARFGVECLEPAKGSVALREVYATYLAWCSDRGVEPLPAPQIGAQLSAMFAAAGLQTVKGRVRGVGLKKGAVPLALAAE